MDSMGGNIHFLSFQRRVRENSSDGEKGREEEEENKIIENKVPPVDRSKRLFFLRAA